MRRPCAKCGAEMDVEAGAGTEVGVLEKTGALFAGAQPPERLCERCREEALWLGAVLIHDDWLGV